MNLFHFLPQVHYDYIDRGDSNSNKKKKKRKRSSVGYCFRGSFEDWTRGNVKTKSRGETKSTEGRPKTPSTGPHTSL